MTEEERQQKIKQLNALQREVQDLSTRQAQFAQTDDRFFVLECRIKRISSEAEAIRGILTITQTH